eukprot:SAG25_NODE_10706_length_324_cov_1.600000_2_plen_51_part_01
MYQPRRLNNTAVWRQGLDADSSGSLDAEEVRQVLRGMGRELPEGEFQQAMR